MNTIETKKRIEEIEALMLESDFWNDSVGAQLMMKELQNLKTDLIKNDFSAHDTIISIIAGAGGDDSEDFVSMLFSMYEKYITNRGWGFSILDSSPNTLGGYKNIMFEVKGKNSYGMLKNESGVHRLVRMSPFNSEDFLRQRFLTLSNNFICHATLIPMIGFVILSFWGKERIITRQSFVRY